mgnify:CR=1 FL=1
MYTSLCVDKNSQGAMPFVEKLRELLADPAKNSDCLTWDQNGEIIIGKLSQRDRGRKNLTALVL